MKKQKKSYMKIEQLLDSLISVHKAPADNCIRWSKIDDLSKQEDTING